MLKRLTGNELTKHMKELELKGFNDVVKGIMKKLENGDDVTYHEVRYVLKKMEE